jgi:hypothetical protein
VFWVRLDTSFSAVNRLSAEGRRRCTRAGRCGVDNALLKGES